ncbi:PE-PGRS family protein [Streptomyces roseifaciens]
MFAAVCVLLAALGHAVMSGTTVPWWAVAVALCGTGSGAWFLAGRERGPLLITLATVGAQTGLHFFFGLAQNVVVNAARAARLGLDAGMPMPMPMPMPMSTSTSMDMPAGHSMASMPAMEPAEPMPMPMDMDMGSMDMGSMGDMAGHSMSMHAGHGALGMWTAHVLVAVICGMWLAGGEQAAFRLARTLRSSLFTPFLVLFRTGAAPSGPPRIRADRSRAAQRLRQLLYAHVLATRGPPARVAVAFG